VVYETRKPRCRKIANSTLCRLWEGLNIFSPGEKSRSKIMGGIWVGSYCPALQPIIPMVSVAVFRDHKYWFRCLYRALGTACPFVGMGVKLTELEP